MGKNRQVGKYLTPRLGNADFHSKINSQKWGNFGEKLLIPKNEEKFKMEAKLGRVTSRPGREAEGEEEKERELGTINYLLYLCAYNLLHLY